MPGQNPDSSAIRRVELAVSQCESLSILPVAASRFLSQLGGMELTPSSLAELVESDPALAVLALRLCQNKGITIRQYSTWTQQALEGLSLREIRDAVLSAKICGGLTEDARTNFRKELTRHSLAVACCAERLAQLASPQIEGATAYLAGLLHDIGKFLLDETMPKSFDSLLEQAKSGKMSFCKAEMEGLGVDHTILGKRFAQRMQLPGDIILGIWLHHSQTGAISQTMPQARIAGVVALADCIVRRAGIGESGSYDEVVLPDIIAGSLGLTDEHIRQVEQQLPDIVRRKSEVAGLTLLRPGWAYCDALRAMTSQLAGENAKLFEENIRLQSNASHFDFVRGLLPKINSTMTTIELAESFAIGWQRFYQTGPVCLYLVGENGAKHIEAVVIESQTKTKTAALDVPEDAILIPEPMRKKFAVIDAADYADWLLEQIEVEFDMSRTRMAPLSTAGRTTGVIIFELRHPVDSTSSPQAEGEISEKFESTARIGGMVLDMLETIRNQQWYAECFARLPASPPTTEQQQLPQAAQPGLEALAEMAAGAAHELNNPLSVISGRAQLLAKSETDAEKKRILEQIQQNAGELSAIIDDLMSYANPETPRPTETPVRQIIEEAIDLAGLKTNIDQSDIEIDVPSNMPDAMVDSAQLACAISNIICNGLEAYDKGGGPLTIKTSADGEGVSIQVIDSGRGMDEQTLGKATQPFFSARTAGRKRGMGLAHAQRLIEINNGKLELASRQGKGTTVTVKLSCK